MSVAIKILFFSVALMSTFANAGVLTTKRMNIKRELTPWEDLEKLNITSDKGYKTELSPESKKNYLNTEPSVVVFQNYFLTPIASKHESNLLKSSFVNKHPIFNQTGSLKNKDHPDEFKCYVCNKCAEATCDMMNQGVPKESIRHTLVHECRTFYKICEVKICIGFVHDYFERIVDLLVDQYYISEICPYLLGCFS